MSAKPVEDDMNVEMFMAENAAKIKDVSFVVSNRFKDKSGDSLPWMLHAVSGATDAKLRTECTEGKKFNGNKYTLLLAAATVKTPNLNNAKLQDSYHAVGSADLLGKMLLGGELNNLILKAQEVNGYIKDMNALIKEVKNA